MKKAILVLLVISIMMSFSGCFLVGITGSPKIKVDNKISSSMIEDSFFEESEEEFEESYVNSKADDASSKQSNTSSTVEKKYVADFVGKTVGDVYNAYGYNFENGSWGGSINIYSTSLGLCFFLDSYEGSPTRSNKITSVLASGNNCLFENLYASMTYKEVVKAVGKYVQLEEPEYYYDEHDDVWTYTLDFNYRNYHFNYIWYKNPNTNKSDEVYVSK